MMSFNISISGAYSAQRAIAVTSDNISNTRTTAFKSREVSFGEVFGVQPLQNSRSIVGNGVQLNKVSQSLGTGSVSVTGNALDLAIAGNAMFVVAPDQGIKPDTNQSASQHKYTKNGSFNIDALGYLRTDENLNVLDIDKRPIKFPTTMVSEATVIHKIQTNINQLLPTHSNLAGASITFLTESKDDILSWEMNDGLQSTPGSISFLANSIYYVPKDSTLVPAGAIRVGEVSSNSDGSLSLNFSNPVVKAPYQRIIEREVFSEVEVEYEELVEKIRTDTVLVEEEQEVDVTKTTILDTFTTSLANFNDDNWAVVNSRFFSGQTSVNGVVSLADKTYGPNANSDLGDIGTISFSSKISESGDAITLETKPGTAGRYQTTRGPYLHNTVPIPLSAGSKISFDWTSRGSADAFDIFAYLYNQTTKEYVEVLNRTGTSTSGAEAGHFDFEVPSDGIYDLVFVGGTYDLTGGQFAGANFEIQNLSIDVAETEEVTVKEKIKVLVAKPIEIIEHVWEKRTRIETVKMIEMEEETFYEDLALVIDGDVLQDIGQQFTSVENVTIHGYEAPKKSLRVEIFRNSELKASQAIDMQLTDVQVSSSKEILDRFDSITIDDAGNINALYGGIESGNRLIGQLGFVAPINESQIFYESGGYFSDTAKYGFLHVSSIASNGGGSVIQGALEQSNVDLTQQLASLLQKQMLFQSNSKAIQAYMSANEQLQNIR
jgi:flagellar hook-basal body protein